MAACAYIAGTSDGLIVQGTQVSDDVSGNPVSGRPSKIVVVVVVLIGHTRLINTYRVAIHESTNKILYTKLLSVLIAGFHFNTI